MYFMDRLVMALRTSRCSKVERRLVSILGRLIDCNPFLPKRTALKKEALDRASAQTAAHWNLAPTIYRRFQNVMRMGDTAAGIDSATNERPASAQRWTAEHGNRMRAWSRIACDAWIHDDAPNVVDEMLVPIERNLRVID